MNRILIADDNEDIVNILKKFAEKENLDADVAFDGQQALDMFDKNNYDLILLDIMMPKKDGYEVCKTIRKTSMVPIIMITAKGEDYEKIMGLDLGADDYIVKPFSVAEVMARVRAILRRIEKKSGQNPALVIDSMKLDLDSYTFEVDGQNVDLTKKEFELLWTLASNTGKVYTRENLLDSLWGYDYYGDSRTVDTHVKRLRAKLAAFPGLDDVIKTIRGVGYKFKEPDNK
ncbi:MAG TPA: response regulator transcription factor [Clostridia bacterium]|nr:MAG: Transcriptional regulatory protein YycF [Firmicutes bacterium ADurb.Bin099]HHT95977.1 response regulator transcription factor [Clostridiaceae bacterium]HOF27170.1 response regulator transcription factor [Clostridia bacterium]HOM34822.1 response regulator transcription factor [Clostridia bacterium]HOR89999.1 response regulator transcription factor [Clostridia bacterium]